MLPQSKNLISEQFLDQKPKYQTLILLTQELLWCLAPQVMGDPDLIPQTISELNLTYFKVHQNPVPASDECKSEGSIKKMELDDSLRSAITELLRLCELVCKQPEELTDKLPLMLGVAHHIKETFLSVELNIFHHSICHFYALLTRMSGELIRGTTPTKPLGEVLEIFLRSLLNVCCAYFIRKELQHIWESTFPLCSFTTGREIYLHSTIESQIGEQLKNLPSSERIHIKKQLEEKYNPCNLDETEHERFFIALSVNYQIADNLHQNACLENQDTVYTLRVEAKDSDDTITHFDVMFHAEDHAWIYANAEDPEAISRNNNGIIQKMLPVTNNFERGLSIIKSTLTSFIGSFYAIRDAVAKSKNSELMNRYCRYFWGNCIDGRVRSAQSFASSDFNYSFQELTEKFYQAVYATEYSHLDEDSYFFALALLIRDLWNKTFNKEFTQEFSLHPKEGCIDLTIAAIVRQRLLDIVGHPPKLDFVSACKLLPPSKRSYFFEFLKLDIPLLENIKVVEEGEETKDALIPNAFEEFMLLPCTEAESKDEDNTVASLLNTLLPLPLYARLMRLLSVKTLLKLPLKTELLLQFLKDFDDPLTSPSHKKTLQLILNLLESRFMEESFPKTPETNALMTKVFVYPHLKNFIERIKAIHKEDNLYEPSLILLKLLQEYAPQKSLPFWNKQNCFLSATLIDKENEEKESDLPQKIFSKINAIPIDTLRKSQDLIYLLRSFFSFYPQLKEQANSVTSELKCIDIWSLGFDCKNSSVKLQEHVSQKIFNILKSNWGDTLLIGRGNSAENFWLAYPHYEKSYVYQSIVKKYWLPFVFYFQLLKGDHIRELLVGTHSGIFSQFIRQLPLEIERHSFNINSYLSGQCNLDESSYEKLLKNHNQVVDLSLKMPAQILGKHRHKILLFFKAYPIIFLRSDYSERLQAETALVSFTKLADLELTIYSLKVNPIHLWPPLLRPNLLKKLFEALQGVILTEEENKFSVELMENARKGAKLSLDSLQPGLSRIISEWKSEKVENLLQDLQRGTSPMQVTLAAYDVIAVNFFQFNQEKQKQIFNLLCNNATNLKLDLEPRLKALKALHDIATSQGKTSQLDISYRQELAYRLAARPDEFNRAILLTLVEPLKSAELLTSPRPRAPLSSLRLP